MPGLRFVTPSPTSATVAAFRAGVAGGDNGRGICPRWCSRSAGLMGAKCGSPAPGRVPVAEAQFLRLPRFRQNIHSCGK